MEKDLLVSWAYSKSATGDMGDAAKPSVPSEK